MAHDFPHTFLSINKKKHTRLMIERAPLVLFAVDYMLCLCYWQMDRCQTRAKIEMQ